MSERNYAPVVLIEQNHVTDWDAVIVGAGVAGGCTACMLADRGWRVLLVERSAWPRTTVCGGCLSAAALDSLRQLGLLDAVANAMQTRSVAWHCKGRSFVHAIPPGVAVLRVDLDSAIVNLAQQRGVTFIAECSAALLPASDGDPFRMLRLKTSDGTSQIRAGVVIACDGLNGTLLKDESWAGWTISDSAMIGVSTTYPSAALTTGEIHMSMANAGYVGRVRVDESTEHLAAALHPVYCQKNGGPLNVIEQILDSCGQSVPFELRSARLHGTGKLTRYRKQIGGHRVLTVGDACGYVEPITGEGMAWAARGAIALGQIMSRSSADWPADFPRLWKQQYQQAIGRQMHWCRLLRGTAHNPWLADAGILLASTFPGVARHIARMICEPKPKDGLHDSIGDFLNAKHPKRAATENPGDRHRQPTGGAAAVVAGSGNGSGML